MSLLRTLPVPLVLCSASAASSRQLDSHTPGHPAGIAYVSDETQNDVAQLYFVPVDGSAAPVQLNGALPAGGDVVPYDFVTGNLPQISGRRVVYVADAVTNDVFELFSVLDDASAPPVQLSGPLVTGGDVNAFVAGKRRVVYLADATQNGRDELFSAPLDASAAPIALTPDLPAPFDVYRIVQLSRDERLVLFTRQFGLEELYVVPTDGSAPPLLLDDSGIPSSFASTYFRQIEIAPDGAHVVYIATEEDEETRVGDIFCARLDGSTPPRKLNTGASFGMTSVFATDQQFQIARNGQRVVWVEPSGSDSYLHSARLDGTGLVDLVPPGERAHRLFRLSADSVYATFVSEAAGTQKRLVLARLDGTQSLQLTEPVAQPFYGLELAPGGTSLIYAVGDPVGSSATSQLFSLHVPNQPIALAGAPQSPRGVFVGGLGEYDWFEFTPGGERVVFRGDLDTDEVRELYSVLLDGSQPPQRLCAPLSGERDAGGFRVAPGGKRVIYLADQAADTVNELFSVPVDGSVPAVRLGQAPVAGGDVNAFAVPGSLVKLARAP